jgi:energy-coupling factor transporter ATP-binding protein EcfA2
MIVGMPFTCEACGSRTDLMPAVGDVLRCPHCSDERPFVRPPLLVVTGPAGVGKSTLCARLAGTIPRAVLLDADIVGERHVSVVSPNPDYTAFWWSMMRLAHELAQNDLVVAYFSVMLPEQVLANSDALRYFESVHFLCLAARPDVLRARIARQAGSIAVTVNIDAYLDERTTVWNDFNTALLAAASDTPRTTTLDASRPIGEVELDVRDWINALLHRRHTIGRNATA